MWINEHQKKGCDKVVDSERNLLKLKLYPPLKNATKSVCLMKGGNILEYKVKANALSKPRSNCPSTTLVLQPIQKFKHKHKKEKTLPWFMMKFKRISFLSARNASRNMEVKQSNKF
jgi:hypothetical protein